MNEAAENGWDVRKIAVAFDPACGATSLLDAAAEWAALLGAELEACFVDDPDIGRLAGLPFGRIIDPGSGRSMLFDAAALQSRRAGLAARSRASLRRLSKIHRFGYSVRDLPGAALMEVEAQSTAELLIVAAFHGKFGGTRAIDEDAVEMASRSARSVLLVAQFPVSMNNILVVADDGPAGRRAERLAALLAGRANVRVTALEPAGVAGEDLAATVRNAGPSLVIIGLSDTELTASLQRALKHETFSLLAVR